jgi:hypothetical protein
VGDTDEGIISLMRGFFYGTYHAAFTRACHWNCPTLNETHSVPMSEHRFDKKGKIKYTGKDNTEGKEAFIEFEALNKHGEKELVELFAKANLLLKLDEV